jgi:Cu/Ag efflux pump CusA
MYIAPAPNGITREAASRRIDVSLNPSDRSLDAVARDVATALAGVKFDTGYYPEVLGEYAELKASQSRLYFALLISFAAIFLILHALYQSVRIAIIVFFGLAGTLIGGIIGAIFGGSVISLGSLIGFITVLGISARTSVMLVSHFKTLEETEQVPFGASLVIQGAEERLTPILMTALTTALALLPLAIGGVKPGHEIEHPMAIVIIFGLIASVIVNLFVIPPLYLRHGKSRTAEA